MRTTTQTNDDGRIGLRLRRLRNKSGLSGAELARLAGIATSLVSMVEHGRRVAVAAGSAVGLARVLGTTAEYLVTGGGSEPSTDEVRSAVAAAVARAGVAA